MRTLLAASALLLSLAIPAAAHADTINFSSAAGQTTYTYLAGQGFNNGKSGTAVAYQNPAYASPIAGSQWVSTSSTGGSGAIGITDYTTTFNLLAGESYTGTFSFMADDLGAILINGVVVDPLSFLFSGYDHVTNVSLDANDFVAGLNTITLVDFNLGGAAAVDYSGTLHGTAVTPEPTSLFLLGSGILCLAIFTRGSFFRA